MTELDFGLDSGFASPVLQSQAIFRAIMDALANPGTVQKLTQPAAAHGALTSELASILLTLADQDTPIWLANSAGVAPFIAFHTGAPITPEPARATFAFAGSAAELPRLDQFNLGSQEYPDRSTTIVLAVKSLSGGNDLTLRGPGIKGHARISPIGLPEDFVTQWEDNRELFPRGIDLLLVAVGAVLGLPRSTRITEEH